MTHLRSTLTASLLAALLIGLAGCGGSGSGSGEKTGTISLGVSDGPVHDANKVCVAFNEIEFKGAGESIVVRGDGFEVRFEPPVTGFVGFVAPFPIINLHFDEDAGGDDIVIRDFRFGSKN